ncbi:peptide/nickel transport system substrate-binding protein [Sporobacter termitidis DSM 10068]|uniref:Peptide/nickel transport system substrate-binding protein n=1 Tax=Sporobacter termitidis DSM 10068 TaxID=1123282 RepID=A0A1M5XH31_9FIRM|nr:ABC transporter substrate-binding protein [Sporobacter termitidis]SHH99185.1 peptide/nickel transport system substrate-binding protein [Sporobacter termitidis DSM 10068]
MKKAVALVLALILALTLGACGRDTKANTQSSPVPGSSPSAAGTDNTAAPPAVSGAPEYGGVLRIVNTSEGATPLGVPWEVIGIDVNLITPYGEALLLEKTSGEIEPWLAADWKIDTTNLTVTFTLRQDVKFTDGSDFNADVAAWNIQQAIDAGIINPAISGVSVTGPYEIKVQLDNWSNTILSTFASHSFSMISKEAFEKNGIDWARENPVGTGPFKLKEYVRGERITYEKNENYWQAGKPYLDGVEYVFIRDVMTQNAAVQASGDQGVDVLNTNSAEQMITLNSPDIYLDKMAIGPVSLVPSSNNPDSPLSKLEVRQAISYAIDRQSLVDARGFGILTPATQFIPDTWGAHLPDSYNLSYNTEKAKELLAQAGYPNGFTTKLIAMPGMVDKDMVVAVQSMLQAVGINVELEFPDSGGYSNYRFNGWEGMLVQHTRSLPAIANTFGLYFDVKKDDATGAYSYIYMPSTWRPLEELYNAEQAAGQAIEPDDKLLQDVHKIIMDNMICIPLYNIYDAFIIKNNVHDTGFSQWGAGTMFLPADAWKSSK